MAANPKNSAPPIPKRIQRKRTRGWRMPENTKYVGRGSKFGNPFRLIGDMIYVDAIHRRKTLSRWVCYYPNGGYTTEDVVILFRDLLLDLNSHEVEPEIYARFRWMRDHIRDLQGKDLSCWCKKECACHADALIELANS